MSGAEASRPESGNEIFLRETEGAFRRTVRRYLGGLDKFHAMPVKVLGGGIKVDFLGMLDCDLVEAYSVPNSRYGEIPQWQQIAAATKASLAGADSAWVITTDRDKQDWVSWHIQGDFEKVADPILHDINFIEGLFSGESARIGTATSSTCAGCPFKKSCDADVAGSPQPLSAGSLEVRQDFSLTGKLDEFLYSLNSEDDGRATKCIHPSEFSTSDCDRQIAYGLLGEKQESRVDPKLRRIFDMGHAVHEVVQTTLKWKLGDGFREEALVVNEGLRIVGHCDGVFEKDGLEIKSMGQNGFSKLSGAKSEHKQQATIYGVNLEREAIRYLYVCKEDADMKEFRIPVDPKEWQRIVNRASNIVKTVDAGGLPPQIEKEYVCRGCKYAWKCKPYLVQAKGIRRRI